MSTASGGSSTSDLSSSKVSVAVPGSEWRSLSRSKTLSVPTRALLKAATARSALAGQPCRGSGRTSTGRR
eukprot:2665916-Alexandrium_andersonii.AAC.1